MEEEPLEEQSPRDAIFGRPGRVDAVDEGAEEEAHEWRMYLQTDSSLGDRIPPAEHHSHRLQIYTSLA